MRKAAAALLGVLTLHVGWVAGGPSIGFSSPDYTFAAVPGAIIRTYATVYNPGDSPATIHLSAEGVDVRFEENDFELEPGESRRVYLFIKVPENLPNGIIGTVEAQVVGAGNIGIGATRRVTINIVGPEVRASIDTTSVGEGRSFGLRVVTTFQSLITVKPECLSCLAMSKTEEQAYAGEVVVFRVSALTPGVHPIRIVARNESLGLEAETTIEVNVSQSGQVLYILYPKEIDVKVGEEKDIEVRASKTCRLEVISAHGTNATIIEMPETLHSGVNTIRVRGDSPGQTVFEFVARAGEEEFRFSIKVNVKKESILPVGFGEGGKTAYLIGGAALLAAGISLKLRRRE